MACAILLALATVGSAWHAPSPRRAVRSAVRLRAASDVAALADRLVASEEKEGEARQPGPDDDEPEVEEEVEEDEPDDYMRDYYDEDNDALEGDDNEPVF